MSVSKDIECFDLFAGKGAVGKAFRLDLKIDSGDLEIEMGSMSKDRMASKRWGHSS